MNFIFYCLQMLEDHYEIKLEIIKKIFGGTLLTFYKLYLAPNCVNIVFKFNNFVNKISNSK